MHTTNLNIADKLGIIQIANWSACSQGYASLEELVDKWRKGLLKQW